MTTFVGRDEYLAELDRLLDAVGEDGSGRMVSVRGRRQVGKSRLLSEWLSRRDARHVYYQALQRPDLQEELAGFSRAVARSNLPVLPDVAANARWSSWQAALESLTVAADDGPIVVVIDEFPYLDASDDAVEATVQAVWDHTLQHLPVLLVLVGSDLAMMSRLHDYDRPLYGRISNPMVVTPLNPAEVGQLLRVDATEALDTYLHTGGFPRVVGARASYPDLDTFLTAETAQDNSALVVEGERMLNAEFGSGMVARDILLAIGSGERAYGKIQKRAGITQRTLSARVEELIGKQVVARTQPMERETVSARPRYVISDPYLRFWMRFLAGRVSDIQRGRGDLVRADIAQGWQSYAGRAVEPLVRDAMERLLPDARFNDARYVGAYWGRDNTPEIDLIGTSDGTSSPRIEFAGSIKWRDGAAADATDCAALVSDASGLQGWETTSVTVGVSRCGFTDDAFDVQLTPDDLIAAWTID